MLALEMLALATRSPSPTRVRLNLRDYLKELSCTHGLFTESTSTKDISTLDQTRNAHNHSSIWMSLSSTRRCLGIAAGQVALHQRVVADDISQTAGLQS